MVAAVAADGVEDNADGVAFGTPVGGESGTDDSEDEPLSVVRLVRLCACGHEPRLGDQLFARGVATRCEGQACEEAGCLDGWVAREVGAVEVVDEDGEAARLDERARKVIRGEIGEHGGGVDHELLVDGQLVDAGVVGEEVLGRGPCAVGREVEELKHGVGVCEVGDGRFVLAECLADAGTLKKEQRHVFVGCSGHLARAIEQR